MTGNAARPDSPRPYVYERGEVALTDITVLKRLRSPHPALVRALSTSMTVAGLIHPIVLRSSSAGYYLVVGWHRLEAARKLGWQTIRATVFFNMTSDQAALVEIESNLRPKAKFESHRPTPTPDERAEEGIIERRRSWKAAARGFFGLRGRKTNTDS